MATAAVSVTDLTSGNLPTICAKTGLPADGVARITFVQTPGWTWILILFGILPFLIARFFARRRVTGLVPMSHQALDRGRDFNWIVRAALVLGVALLVAAMVLHGSAPGLEWMGLVAVLSGLMVLAFGWGVVWPTGRLAGDWVWLSRLHPDFARAVGRMYADVPAGQIPR